MIFNSSLGIRLEVSLRRGLMGLVVVLLFDFGGYFEVRGYLVLINGCSFLYGNYFLTVFFVLGIGLGFR